MRQINEIAFDIKKEWKKYCTERAKRELNN